MSMDQFYFNLVTLVNDFMQSAIFLLLRGPTDVEHLSSCCEFPHRRLWLTAALVRSTF